MTFLEKSDVYHLVKTFPKLDFLAERLYPTKHFDLPQFMIDFSFTSCQVITGLDETCQFVKRVFRVLSMNSHIKDVRIVQEGQGLAVLNYKGDLVVVDLKNGDKATKRKVYEIVDYDSWKGLNLKLFKDGQSDEEEKQDYVLKTPYSLRGSRFREFGRLPTTDGTTDDMLQVQMSLLEHFNFNMQDLLYF